MTFDSGVRYCVSAVIDLLGFSAHLEVGGHDVRTKIGNEALERLTILERALSYMESERSEIPDAYPAAGSFQFTRLNDAIILNLDLPEFLKPRIGDTGRNGFTLNELMPVFDFEKYGVDGDDQYAKEFQDKLETDVGGLIKFIGLVARLLLFVNSQDSRLNFPGAKAICVTGFRRPFTTADGTDDMLAANFSYSNAFMADSQLHGGCLFIDDNILHLLIVNKFARNLVQRASLVWRSLPLDLSEEPQEGLRRAGHRVPSIPQEVQLFRRRFWFRELDTDALSYLQMIHRLAPYLTGEKKRVSSRFNDTFSSIQNGPDVDLMREGVASPDALYPLAINEDLRLIPEHIETGTSATSNAKRRTMFANDPFGASMSSAK